MCWYCHTTCHPFMAASNLFRNFDSPIIESINVVDIYLTKSECISTKQSSRNFPKSDIQSAAMVNLDSSLDTKLSKNLLNLRRFFSSSLYSHMPFRNLSHQLCLIVPYRICFVNPYYAATAKIVADYQHAIQVELLGNQLISDLGSL